MGFSYPVHWLYEKHYPRWRFCELSYIGGDEYRYPDLTTRWPYPNIVGPEDNQTFGPPTWTGVKSFLYPHNRESEHDFFQRVIRSYYRNMTKPCVDTYTSQTFSKPIHRDEGAVAALKDVWEDVDYRGSTIDDFMRDGESQAQIFDHTFCVIDMPRLQPGEILTIADEAEAGLRPYACWYKPTQVPNWEVDRYGRFLWVSLLEADLRHQRTGPDDKVTPSILVRTWYPDRWELHEYASDGDSKTPGKLIDQGPNPLGRVPVEVLYAKRLPGEIEPVGVWFTPDVAKLNQEIYNVDSMKQDMIANQNFAFLAVPDKNRKVTQVTVGTQRAMTYDPEGGGTPTYVSPPSDHIECARDEVIDLVWQIRSLAGLNRGVSEQSKSQRSGEAIALESADKMSLIKALAHEAQDFEERFCYLVGQWSGREWEGHVKYPESYDVNSLAENLENALAYEKLQPPVIASAELLKTITRDVLCGLPEEELSKILDAIDAQVAEKEALKKAMALLPPTNPDGTPAPPVDGESATETPAEGAQTYTDEAAE